MVASVARRLCATANVQSISHRSVLYALKKYDLTILNITSV